LISDEISLLATVKGVRCPNLLVKVTLHLIGFPVRSSNDWPGMIFYWLKLPNWQNKIGKVKKLVEPTERL